MCAVPAWVAYELRWFPEELPGPYEDRPSPWMTGENLRKDGSAPDDDSYRGSGYSQGHLAMRLPARRLGRDASWNTHPVLNAERQLQSHNVGPWLQLENLTADWTDTYGTVWIIAGPVFNDNTPSRWIGDSGQVRGAVLDPLFKIVIKEGPGGEEPDVLAFLFPHTHKPEGGGRC